MAGCDKLQSIFIDAIDTLSVSRTPPGIDLPTFLLTNRFLDPNLPNESV